MVPDGKWEAALSRLGLKPKRKISDPIPQGDVFSVNASQLCVMNKHTRALHVDPHHRSPVSSTSDNMNPHTPTSSSSLSGSYIDHMPMTPSPPTSFDSISGSSLNPVAMASHIAQSRLATLFSDSEDRIATHKKLSKDCLNVHLQASMTMMDDVVVKVTPENIVSSKLALEHIRDGFFRYADSLGDEAKILELETTDYSKPLPGNGPVTYPAKAFGLPKKRPSGMFMDEHVELLPPPWGKSATPKPSVPQPGTPQYHPKQQTDDPYSGLEPKVMKQQTGGYFNNDSNAQPRKIPDYSVRTNYSSSSKEPMALKQQGSGNFMKEPAVSLQQTANYSLPTNELKLNNEKKTLKQQPSSYFMDEPQPSQQEISHYSSSSTYSVREPDALDQQLSDCSLPANDSKKLPTGPTSCSTPLTKSAIGSKKDLFEDFDPEFIKALNLSTILPANRRLLSHGGPLNPTADDFVPSLQGSGPRTYTVSSDEWVMIQSTPSPLSPVKVVAHGMDNVDEMIHRGVVMRIFTKLYTMAKLMQVILLSYGVEVDDSPNGLMFWIRRSEEHVRCHDIAVLIEIVEHLYYVLYARVVIELANIELCSSVEEENTQRRAHSRTFLLPSADHLYRIVLAFKDVMDSRDICAMLQKDVVEEYQRQYINSATEISNKKGEALYDRFGYRRYVLNIVINREGSYFMKWKSLIPFFDTIAPGVIVLLSDKYRTLDPVIVLPDDIPYDELPFINPIQLGPITCEEETVKDNRLASLAKLNQISIGEQRLQDPSYRPYWLAKEQKCICPSTCRCSDECTCDAARCCPCSERHVRLMTIMRRHDYSGAGFITRVNTAARMHFYGLSFLKHNVTEKVIMDELQTAFDMIEMLICKERHEPVPRPVLRAASRD